MNKLLFIGQIIVSLLLIIMILLQEGEGGLGSTFGFEGPFYGKMRGLKKKLYIFTILLGGLFILISLLNLVIQ